MKYERRLVNLVLGDSIMMDILRTVRSLDLPEWWIGAGFVRNKVWDVLCNLPQQTGEQRDVDVLYFNPTNTSEAVDNQLNIRLEQQLPEVTWECVNQARTHRWHDHPPYSSSLEALSTWVETATAIAVRLNDDDTIEVAAPFGLDDLFAMIVRPTPRASLDDFERRYKEKGWLTRWPKLRIIHDK